jgi:VIT1/CCC1 family predicted Fe2+/Mn2+ transporter
MTDKRAKTTAIIGGISIFLAVTIISKITDADPAKAAGWGFAAGYIFSILDNALRLPIRK